MKELKKSLLLLTVFFFAALSLTNCRETKEDKAEDAIEEVEDAAEEVGDEVEDAADDVEEEVKDATDDH